jgi:hypothetical protein
MKNIKEKVSNKMSKRKTNKKDIYRRLVKEKGSSVIPSSSFKTSIDYFTCAGNCYWQRQWVGHKTPSRRIG